jgi:hypothetical protein
MRKNGAAAITSNARSRTSDSQAEIVRAIKRAHRAGAPLNYSSVRAASGPLLQRAQKEFGSWRLAIEAAGLDYEKISRIRRWSEKEIRHELRELYKRRDFADISTLRHKHPKLYAASCRRFGSGLEALEAIGIDYAQLLSERPDRWSKTQIVDHIKRRYADGETLCRAAILRDEPKQLRFCYAATHQFGNWGRALRAAGLSPDEIRNRDGVWPRERVLTEIRGRFEKGKLLNTDTMLREDLTLHAAGRRHFGSWEKAIKKAGVDYHQHVRGGLQGWTRAKTERALRKRISARDARKQIQEKTPSLYRAAVHHFGSWEQAERFARRRK